MPTLMRDRDNQSYMIARQLNSGVFVAETVVEGSPEPAVAEVGSGSLLHRVTGGLLGTPPAKPVVPAVRISNKRLHLPYGVEGVVLFMPVEILRDDVLRFCPLEKAVGTPEFHGVEETTHFDEGRVEVYSTNRIKGFRPRERRKAVIRCLGGEDGHLRATVEDLVALN